MRKKPLSPALENYLEIIYLEERRAGAARASAIAEAAEVSRSTVTNALKVLGSLGLVDYAPYSLVHLTESGRMIGRDIAHRHVIFREFLLNILELDHDKADSVACELEHVVPEDVIRRLGQFVLYVRGNGIMKGWRSRYATERDDLIKGMEDMLGLREVPGAEEEADEIARKYR